MLGAHASPYPNNLWCSLTTNATYHFVGGGTSTQDYVTTGSISFHVNSGCGVFVLAPLSPRAQCGPTCNGVAEPINPATGAVYDTIADVPALPGSPAFKHFYNSADSGSTDLSGGWRHSFSRAVAPRYSSLHYMPYVPGPDTSSLYSDEQTACTSGFLQIKSRVSTWQNATASYANGVCTLTVAGTTIGTLDLIYSLPSTEVPGMPLIGFDATRDDGQLVSFVLNGSAIAAPPGINLRLQQTSGGYTLTDANDNVESYDTNGRLLSVTSRAGVVQTMAYDSSGHLSGVTDSFGHSLSLSYDSSDRLSSVTRQ
jgi:YD repeat-containing protein